MSKISDLIKELCPNGVEYKKLEDCCKILDNKRKPVSKGLRETGIYPYYGANGIQDYISDYLFDGNFVLVGEDGSVKTENDTPVVNWAVGKIWVNNHAHVIEELDGVLLRYLYHYLQIVNIKDLIHGNIPKLNQGDFRNIKIAVPPLEVQEEIVRILDKFGELEVELEAELETRKSQYEFWRGELLSGNKAKVKFGDIATILRGGSPRPIQNFITDDINGIPWIKIGDTNPNDKYVTKTKEKITIDGSKKSRFVKAGDFILSNSMSFGRPYILKIDGCIHDGWLAISNFEETFLPDFLYHLLCSRPIQNTMAMKASIGTVKNLNADIVKSLELPLYSKEEQRKTIRILDKFEELTNDISVGLPAEIEARRKQYEYYRNKLLSFEVLDAND